MPERVAATARAATARVVRSFRRDPPRTAVEQYWSTHTVNSAPFQTAEESERYLEWRFSEYPLFKDFMGLWGTHDDETILDYGCGPGNDTTGFLLYTDARCVVAADVSRKALMLAEQRVRLHNVDETRHQFLRLSDARPEIALADASVDYIHCAGVLQHTSDPDAILGEFSRVLRPGGSGSIMVYNRDSLWFHLFTAYERMIVEGAFAGLSIEEAFAHNTDGPDCPVSRCFSADEFLARVRAADLEGDYVGGYLSQTELDLFETKLDAAVADERLDPNHRAFLHELETDKDGYPLFRGRHAGIGGVYRIRRD